MKECPRCHRESMEDDEVLNSLSQRDNRTYICKACGDEEAMIDMGMFEPDDVELEFVKTHNRFSGKE